MNHFNKLTPAEAERLALLAEEAAEVIQVIGKVLRHGYRSVHPNGGPHNRDLLADEIGDLMAALEMMQDARDLSVQRIAFARLDKLERCAQYMHHQPKAKRRRAAGTEGNHG